MAYTPVAGGSISKKTSTKSFHARIMSASIAETNIKNKKAYLYAVSCLLNKNPVQYMKEMNGNPNRRRIPYITPALSLKTVMSKI